MAFSSSLMKSRLLSSAIICIYLCSEAGLMPRHQAMAVGIIYGQRGDNLPSPQQAANLVLSMGISKVRIYDANAQILSAFAGTGVELMVTVINDLVPKVAYSEEQAQQWLSFYVLPYLPGTRVTAIFVGDNVLATTNGDQLKDSLIPAMQNLYSALSQRGLVRQIGVFTASPLTVMFNLWPPSQGSFTQEAGPYVQKLLGFLSDTGAPFWINAYPFALYDPTRIQLDYALGNPHHVGGFDRDPKTGFVYTSMMYAQVDAVRSAVAGLGYTNVPVHVSGTGWPSEGDANEAGATRDNACRYYRYLMTRQANGEGTPLSPNVRLEVYIYALFDEDRKDGSTSQRHFGLFTPNMTTTVCSNNGSLPTATSTMLVASAPPKKWVIPIAVTLALASTLGIGGGITYYKRYKNKGVSDNVNGNKCCNNCCNINRCCF